MARRPEAIDTGRASRDRARALIDLHRYDDAVQELRRALGADPTSAVALRLLAQAHCGARRYPEGLDAAESSLAVDPESDWGHRLHSICLSHLGRHDEAIEAAQRAVRLAPDTSEGYAALAEAGLAADNTGLARFAATKTITLAPDQVDGYGLLGRVALTEKRLDEAETLFRRAITLAPESSTLHNNLGATLMRKGAWRPALRCYGEAVRLDPNAEVAQNNIVAVMRGKPRQIGRAWVRFFIVPQLGFIVTSLYVLFVMGERAATYARVRRTLRPVLSPLAMRSFERRVRAVSPLWPPLAISLAWLGGSALFTWRWVNGDASDGGMAVLSVVIGVVTLAVFVRRLRARRWARASGAVRRQ